MEEIKTKKKISKKTAIVIIAVAVAVALVAVIGGVAGHSAYENKQKAFIENYDVDFTATTPQTLLYYYEDGSANVDLSKVVKVSKGASFSVTKIQDEDGTVNKPDGYIIDVSVKKQRLAVVKVVSASGKKNTDYRITVAPESAHGNVIDYNAGGGKIDLDDIFLNYSGQSDIVLPTPVKSFTGASGNVYNFDFEGWYTTETYDENSRIEVIPAGTSGGVKLYAKFADASVKRADDGYTYVSFGNYPQRQVTDYNLLRELKSADNVAYAGANSGDTFEYPAGSGNRYYKFTPANVPNMSENGYSSNSTYLFYVEPVEWRVLKRKGETVSNGENVTLLATSVLNCAPFAANGGFIKEQYDKYAKTLESIGIESFLRYFFDPDTKYYDSDVKKSVDGMYDYMFDATDKNYIQSRQFSRYTSFLSSGTENYNCNMWLLSYSESLNEAYGFSADYRDNDNLRKALVSDFGAANGVYRATSRVHAGQGSWWLRGAGNTYDFEDKRVAYVKYTGYVHAYGALNFEVRSGIRPAVNIRFDSSYFHAA